MCALNFMVHGMYGRVECRDTLSMDAPSVVYVVNEVKYPFNTPYYSLRVNYRINRNKKKMRTSNKVRSFLLSEQEGNILLTAKEYPWSVLQVIPTNPDNFEQVVAKLKERGMVATHDTDRTFCIIHLASGDHDGKHPERFIHLTQNNYKQFLEELEDAMAQAAVWYKTNILYNL